MLRNLNIAPRMALLILVGAGCVLGGMTVASYYTARHLLEQELSATAESLATATAGEIDVVERAVSETVDQTALTLGLFSFTRQDFHRLLADTVHNNPEIFGMGFAPVAPAARERLGGELPYAVRAPGDRMEVRNLAKPGYSYTVMDWFTLPSDLRQPVWTEPYFDEGGGNILMVTYAVPVFHAEDTNQLFGVLAGDVSLEWMSALLRKLAVGRSGFAFLVSRQGTIVAHPRQDWVMNETVFSLLDESRHGYLRKLAQQMVRGKKAFTPYVNLVTGASVWLAFAPVASTGWSVGLVIPDQEIQDKVTGLSRKLALSGLVGFLFLLFVALLIARSITRPLRRLEAATRHISAGRLDVPMPAAAGRDEIAKLSNAFGRMQTDLRKYIEDLRQTTAAKERIEGELHVARAIQMSLVPRTFPPFPHRADVELFALLDPARDIGGDFYDFFMCEDDELCLVIGDVSGKGIPAALFMAVTRTFLKTLWREEKSPAATLRRLNRELAQDNDSCMFVTLFLARVNMLTGRVTFANGGHNLPYILRRAGSVAPIPRTCGALVGAQEDVEYQDASLDLAPGDSIFFYTDGVTEAMNPAGGMYGEARVEAELREHGGGSSAELIKGLRAGLRDFAACADQYDDITMLAFRYLGPQPGGAGPEKLLAKAGGIAET